MNRSLIEHDIEEYMRKKAEQNNALYYKFVSPMNSGVPDRCIIMKGYTIFVELKKPGEKPRKLQEKQIEKMQRHGATVCVIDNKESVDSFFESMKEKRTRKPVDI